MRSAAAMLDALIGRVGKIATPFSIELPDGEKRNLGDGKPEFHVNLRNQRALSAVSSLDDGNICEAYLHGDIDIEGDMLKPFKLRAHFGDARIGRTAVRAVVAAIFHQRDRRVVCAEDVVACGIHGAIETIVHKNP